MRFPDHRRCFRVYPAACPLRRMSHKNTNDIDAKHVCYAIDTFVIVRRDNGERSFECCLAQQTLPAHPASVLVLHPRAMKVMYRTRRLGPDGFVSSTATYSPPPSHTRVLSSFSSGLFILGEILPRYVLLLPKHETAILFLVFQWDIFFHIFSAVYLGWHPTLVRR